MATSTLNPNAPIFVPSAYRQVEDFSDQWWELVQSSPWFRDYWLRECFSESQNDVSFPNISDFVLTDFDFLFDEGDNDTSSFKDEGNKDLVSLGVLKWGKSRFVPEVPRYGEKAPKIVNVKVTPRSIQQPR